MHTAEPAKTLPEIIRVLKPSGATWIYVYGREGVYWRTIATFRRVFSGVSSAVLIERLVALDVPTGRIAEMIDDWKAPFLRNYGRSGWERGLAELGCSFTRLMRGTDYDTSEQLARGGSPDLLGDGDLRYLVTRNTETRDALSARSRDALNGSHIDLYDFGPLGDSDLESLLSSGLAAFEERGGLIPLAE